MNIEVHEDNVGSAGGSSVLIGCDTNAFSIMGLTTSELKANGNGREVLDAYRKTAMSGNYDHLLAVSMAYLDNE